ncbi:MAG TPA: acyltransferase, partial [Bacteroidales bacterium]|nr:acyltransferase [Bacteroidales bacterium]
GVAIFFVISGYLITMSWQRNNNILVFLINRTLRIFPALIIVVLFAIFLVGPLFSELSIKEYFVNKQTFSYFSNISLFKLQNYLPGVFIEGNTTHKINAPLWTLFFEFVMYLLVLFFGLVGLFHSFKKYSIVLLVIGALWYFHSDIPNDLFFLKIHVGNFISFFIYFFMGSLLYVFRDSIPLKSRYLIIGSVLLIASYFSKFFDLFIFIYIPYTIIYIALHVKAFGTFITKHGDLSYGIYIYHYIIQNIIFYMFDYKIGIWYAFVLSLIITLGFAYFSWHGIEKKSLALKEKTYIYFRNCLKKVF